MTLGGRCNLLVYKPLNTHNHCWSYEKSGLWVHSAQQSVKTRPNQLPEGICSSQFCDGPVNMQNAVVSMQQGVPSCTQQSMVVLCQVPAGQQLATDFAVGSGLGQHYVLAAPTAPTVHQNDQPTTQHNTLQPAVQQMHPHLPATIFFAGVNPVAQPETLLRAFAQFGRVMDLNLFRPYKGSRTSKGCGLVVFSQHSEAAAALQTLHGRYTWPGARSPMVVEFWDPNKQHMKKRAQPMHAQMPSAGQQYGYMQPTVVYQQQAVPGMQPLLPASAPVVLSAPQEFTQGSYLVMSGY